MSRHTWLNNLSNEGLKYWFQKTRWKLNLGLVTDQPSQSVFTWNKLYYFVLFRACPFRKILNTTITSKILKGVPEVTKQFSDRCNVRHGLTKASIRFSKEQRNSQSRTEECFVLVHKVNLAQQYRQNQRITRNHTQKNHLTECQLMAVSSPEAQNFIF